jgi:hypothetical protein
VVGYALSLPMDQVRRYLVSGIGVLWVNVSLGRVFVFCRGGALHCVFVLSFAGMQMRRYYLAFSLSGYLVS